MFIDSCWTQGLSQSAGVCSAVAMCGWPDTVKCIWVNVGL
jgi:hypothetical protein